MRILIATLLFPEKTINIHKSIDFESIFSCSVVSFKLLILPKKKLCPLVNTTFN